MPGACDQGDMLFIGLNLSVIWLEALNIEVKDFLGSCCIALNAAI